MKLIQLKFAAAVCALIAGNVCAQALADPTRPPASLRSNAGGEAAAADQAPRLQSILVARGPGGRHLAVIDGQQVRLGENFRGARVERMTHSEVVLSKDGKQQVLKLFPASPAVQR